MNTKRFAKAGLLACTLCFVASGALAQETGSDSRTRLALQWRLNAYNSLFSTSVLSDAPLVTPGVRLLNQRLFVGAGLGFVTVSDGGPSDFTLSPLVSFDLLRRDLAALYLVGWLNIGSADLENYLGEDVFYFGLNAGAGIRGQITDAIAIGSELGLSLLFPEDVSIVGIFGTIMVEASIPI